MRKHISKLGWVALAAIVVYWGATTLAGTAFGGPLDPPSAPSETQKTQITSLPYTISAPGSYVVMADLSCAAACSSLAGITVNASNVTIDLNGFSLNGEPGTFNGIWVPSGGSVVIRNGLVQGWGGAGLNLDGCNRCAVEDIEASSNGASGISLGPSSTIRNTIAAENADFGVRITGPYSSVIDTLVRENDYGVVIDTGGNDLRHVVVAESNSSGIYVLGVENSVTDSVLRDNSVQGLRLSDVGGSDLSNNLVSFSGQHGIHVYDGDNNRVEGNTCNGNGFSGIAVTSFANSADGNRVAENSCNNNTDPGILTDAATSDNAIVNNTASGNSPSDYSLAGAGNTFGPVVTSASLGAVGTEWANIIH